MNSMLCLHGSNYRRLNLKPIYYNNFDLELKLLDRVCFILFYFFLQKCIIVAFLNLKILFASYYFLVNNVFFLCTELLYTELIFVFSISFNQNN